MTLFFENLNKHLDFEWYWENILFEGVVTESRGIFPNEKIYYGRIIDFLKKQKIDITKSGKYSIKIPYNIFDDISNRFFEKIDIVFNIEYGNFGPFVKSNSGYISSNTKFNKETKRIELFKIIFNCKIDLWNNLDVLIPLICHEFLHGYEDQQRILKNNKSLFDINMENRYYDNNLRNSVEGNIRKIRRIIYLFTPSEVNASVSEIIGEIEKNVLKIADKNNILTIVKNTNVFKEYENVGKYIEELSMIKDKSEQERILNYWLNNTNRKIKTYSRLINYLKRYYVNVMNRFNKNISRNSFRIYLSMNGHREDYGYNR